MGTRPEPNAPDDRTSLIERVLAFWFGAPDADGGWSARGEWFRADPGFDTACANRFADACDDALQGGLGALAQTAKGALALVLLLDQFPRNIHRGTRGAFAGDARARDVARAAIARRYDEGMPAVFRLFFYLPFEHAENLRDQERACALIGELGDADWLAYAERHRQIIARFGRFPHRNRVLGRASTADELAFLAEPGSSF
jgi:uncharacterized protein (DUF924 family)